ncbi:NXPE family member 1-like isoform X3 [Ambystoma mexicanum]|uniref:NXPE family member 1-like isoform X3 n=1 Tax=Ambystoma mexicanum TaxID=8296 RepID=UPI0037E820C3
MCPSRMGVALTCRCVSVMGVRCYVSVLLVLRGLSFSRRFCGASETRGRIRRAPGHFLLGRPSTYHNNMHQEAIRGTKLIVALMVLLTCISLTYYSLQTKHLFSKLQNFRYFYRDCAEDPQVKVEVKIAVTETDLEITEIFNEINKTISNVPFIHLNRTTSAEKSKVTILDPKDKYCIGDNLTVQIDVYDFSGKRKEYGGDFIRARIYSPEVKAGTSGIIVDLKNGSYHVHFTLFWEGKVRVSLLLMHPSEGVSALWRARNQGYKNVYWMGKFVNGTRDVQTECGLKFNTMEELCEYPNHCDGEIFYCIKPEHVPCNELKAMAARIRQNSYLTDLEKTIFDNSNNGVEIKKKFEIIDVINCNRTLTFGQEKCKPGVSSPFPSGYFYQNVWRSLFCNVSYYETEELLNPCIQGKLIYLMGDSTLRQWILHFPKFDKGLRFFDLHLGSDWHRNYVALDMDKNLRIQWKKHGHPFISMVYFPIPNDACVTNQINELVGNSYTVVVIALGQHFRAFPFEVFIRRAINVRKAVERLLRRALQTKVIIKMVNTRELHPDAELFSDFHGYVQYLATTRIFQGLNVGVVDAWDMTIAAASENGHPPDNVVHNEINMFLSYMC